MTQMTGGVQIAWPFLPAETADLIAVRAPEQFRNSTMLCVAQHRFGPRVPPERTAPVDSVSWRTLQASHANSIVKSKGETMRKLLVTKWVTALRSKKYKQGDSALRTHTPKGDEFCCLGVLGDLTPRTKDFTWIAPKSAQEGDREFEYSLSDPSNPNMRTTRTLTMDQLARIGMHDEWQTVLVNLNDGGYTFTTIAKLVEKYSSVLHRQVPSELRDECDDYPLDSAALLRAAKIRALPVKSRREKPTRIFLPQREDGPVSLPTVRQ